MPDIFVSKTSKPKQKKEPTASKPKKEVYAAIARIAKGFTKPPRHPLVSFVTFPDGVGFEIQEKEEVIVLLLRPHWIINLPWILLAILFLFAPFIFPLTPLTNFLPTRFNLVLLILWYLLTLSFIFEKFLGWFFNVFLVTDKRVVDVDFYSLTYKEISEASLDKIQDLTYRTGGALGSIIDFGNVFIQTAGQQAFIEFENVPHPAKVVHIINELVNRVKTSKENNL